MEFPPEWQTWNMISDSWIREAMSVYEPGMEQASEHDRNGAFHWWLRGNPTEEQLARLWQLSFLDPDQIMAEDVRGFIRNASNFSKEVVCSAT
jgi:hypothetical protein